MANIEEIIKLFKSKKELKNISDSYLKKIIDLELKKRPYLKNIIKQYTISELKKNEEFMYFFKEIRSNLHKDHGIFSSKNNLKKIFKILEDETLNLKEKVKEILKYTLSTRERLNFYNYIYEEIFDIKKPYKILDIACGLNPISIIFSRYKPSYYYFNDISIDFLEINEIILKQMDIEPIPLEEDLFDLLKNHEVLSNSYTYIFLWKVVPIIDKYDSSYLINLLKQLSFEYAVISFSKYSPALKYRRPIGFAWKKYINNISKKLEYPIIKSFETPKEWFFIIKKI